MAWSVNTRFSNTVQPLAYNNLHMDDPLQLWNMLTMAQARIGTDGIYGGALPNNIMILRKHTKVSVRITNVHASTVKLWEYRIQARQDIPHGDLAQSTFAVALVPNEDQNSAVYSNNLVATQVTQSATPATVGYPVSGGGGVITQSGITPFMAHQFCSRYKVVKVKKWEIRTAHSRRITYKLLKPKLYKTAHIMQRSSPLATYSNTWEMMKGQRQSLFFMEGSYATDQGATRDATSDFSLGITGACIGMEYTTEYGWTFAQTNASASNLANFTSGIADGSGTTQIPLPLIANHPDSAIGTGAAGTRSFGPTYYERISSLSNPTVFNR